MAMQMGGRGGLNSEINVTPMIDLLLVLIIIFMIIRTDTRGVEAEIPQPSKPNAIQPKTDSTVVLSLSEDEKTGAPQASINHQPVPWDQLQQKLVEIYSVRAEPVLFVTAFEQTDFEVVAQAIDVAHHAGISRVGLLPASGS